MNAFYKNTKEQLIESINELNTLPLEVGANTVLLSEAIPTGTDEYVEVGVRGIQGRGYRKDPVRVSYKRLKLDRLFQGMTPSITTLSQSTLHTLLPRLNSILGTRLDVDDIEDIDFTVHGDTAVVELLIVAKPTSRYYSGSFTLTFNRRWLLLNEVVTPLVDAFHHPDPFVENSVSVGLLTWGLDFTSIQPTLAVDPTAANYRGDFTNHGALKQALRDKYNITNWPSNASSPRLESTVVDYATRDVVRANPDFQRVVVQTNIRDREYVGTAYFHYNLP